MAKTIDITDKLAFDENPKLVVKGKELEVNADGKNGGRKATSSAEDAPDRTAENLSRTKESP